MATAASRWSSVGRAVGVGALASASLWGYAQWQARQGAPLNYWPVAQLAATWIEPETAHRLAIRLLAQDRTVRSACLAVDHGHDDPVLSTEVWGIPFRNPVGFAAGFDKNAEAVEGVLDLGVAFVEIGSVTGDPQEGNPRPRVFRYNQDNAIVNRYGFNSDGQQAVRKRLQRLPDELPGLMGVNLGRNKFASNFDYVKGVNVLGKYADYIAINVSSPNTPGLRQLQRMKELMQLLKEIKGAHEKLPVSKRTNRRIPLLLKISPDLEEEDLRDISKVALQVGIDGIIVSNTTTSRGEASRFEAGGLSGAPLFDRSTECLRRVYKHTKGRIPLIGVGGIASGEDAYKKIRAGASLVQLYTSFAFGGPPLIPRIKRELAACLRRDGFNSVAEAVGADAPA
ncbi:hypothetical protein PBRA_000122 [Plasmodiophora brassicae]|uniref:Dihydroorotate dehydrogenase (quinone), mitochondrial n=1 Tax=Plasmodiophora brassicae TaxID=37360 RepID=A0A0G4IGY6_PLABS|nr:hypothetical protein PBRA_000122 [Plasmodiophora brassicae]